MREALIIFLREFNERVRSKAFFWSTVLSPVVMIAMIAIPVIVAKATSVKRHFVLVDEAPPPIGDQFVALFMAHKDPDEGNEYTLERVEATFNEKHDELQARTLNEEIDGYIVLPADVITANQILYRARNVGAESIVKDIRNAATDAVQTERLRQAGLVHADVAQLMRRIEVDDASITATGEGRGAQATFLFAYFLAFLIYIMTAIYGAGVLRSVLEEKTQRIAEVLVSSVKASHLMLGKILGVGSAALLQVLIWAAAMAVFVVFSKTFEESLGVPTGALAAIKVPVGQAVLFGLYFVLGFLLFAALFASVGAAISSEQEAQAMQFPLLIPLFIPLMFSMHITGDPHSILSTVLGLFPLSAPMTMPMRISAAAISPLEIGLSLTFLVLGLLGVAWIGGKVFRIGILSTGKRPSATELWRWLREA